VVIYDELFALQDSLPQNKVILGDFNAHHTLWGSLRVDGRGEQVVKLVNDSDLILLNDGSPTRVDDNTGNLSYIDLSLVSSTVAAKCLWHTIDDSLGSDHFPIFIKYSCDTTRTPSAPKFNVKRADWVAFTRSVKLELVGETIDDKVSNIQNSILDAAMKSIPKTSTDSVKHRVPWWTPDCRRVLCERNRAYRLFKNNINNENFCNYKLARARARRTIRQAKRDSWRSFVSTINSNTKISQVWSTINKINRKKTSFKIKNIFHEGNNLDSPRDIAIALARQFSYTSSSDNYHPAFLTIKEAAELQPIHFATGDELDYNKDLTMNELVRALEACRGTSPGPDEIRYEMIKHLNHDAMIKLLEVYNEIWKSQTFPNSWHFAHIIPILKGGGNPKHAISYRPIALTSCLCKVMERIVNSRLLHFLNSRNLLVDEQCGFRKGRQTLDQLVKLASHIQEAIAKKHFLISVFLDIEKAYDMTWRYGLLRKLYAFGLRGNLPCFIQNFISDRTFAVKLFSDNVTYSDIFVQANGVPQGSVLSPTLFLCMINDILPAPPRNLKYSLYADDCALWHSSSNAEFSANRIQLALDMIHNWGLQWGFKFSTRKSIGVIFSRRRMPNIRLTLDHHPIPIQNSARFLGLLFDRRLNWKDHIGQLKNKCQKALNLLKCISGNKWGADRKSLLMVYKALIRSKVDYGSIVYGSASASTLKGLDVVQNACVRSCLGALKCTRIERLEVESGVPPLRLRRGQLALTYAAKVARDPSHPNGNGAIRPFTTRLHDLILKVGIDLSTIDTLVHTNIAPWETPNFSIMEAWLPSTKAMAPEVEVRQRFREILIKHLPFFHIYTDGSKTEQVVGAGVWSNECELRFRLPNHTSIFIAELFAIDKAIDFALSTTHDRIVIFSDSLSSLKAIKSLETTQNELLGNIIRKLHSANKSIKLIWVPGHSGIHGNEQADRLAGSTDDLDLSIVRTDLRCFVSLIKAKIHLLWQSEWTDLQLTNKVKQIIEVWDTAHRKNRREEVVVARLRVNATRLTHLTPYIERTFPPLCPHCNNHLSINHILTICQQYHQKKEEI